MSLRIRFRNSSGFFCRSGRGIWYPSYCTVISHGMLVLLVHCTPRYHSQSCVMYLLDYRWCTENTRQIDRWNTHYTPGYGYRYCTWYHLFAVQALLCIMSIKCVFPDTSRCTKLQSVPHFGSNKLFRPRNVICIHFFTSEIGGYLYDNSGPYEINLNCISFSLGRTCHQKNTLPWYHMFVFMWSNPRLGHLL